MQKVEVVSHHTLHGTAASLALLLVQRWTGAVHTTSTSPHYSYLSTATSTGKAGASGGLLQSRGGKFTKFVLVTDVVVALSLAQDTPNTYVQEPLAQGGARKQLSVVADRDVAEETAYESLSSMAAHTHCTPVAIPPHA